MEKPTLCATTYSYIGNSGHSGKQKPITKALPRLMDLLKENRTPTPAQLKTIGWYLVYVDCNFLSHERR